MKNTCSQQTLIFITSVAPKGERKFVNQNVYASLETDLKIQHFHSSTCWTDMSKEMYRDVVADKVPVALLRLELDREATHVAQTFW